VRKEFELIAKWIKPKARVLDLGCGDGTLLNYLQTHKSIQGYGLEIDPFNIESCIEAGINVIQQDLDRGLNNFKDDSFDIVLMTQALQTVQNPHLLLKEMLRIGKECIITFPNFGHWRCRLHLVSKGRMPMSKTLPYMWYNTPNIHLCTFKDFEALCREDNISIIDRTVADFSNTRSALMELCPNLLGEVAIYHVTR
jgi:methionine biosynthesis protein MetW